jgi:hypothetical protein
MMNLQEWDQITDELSLFGPAGNLPPGYGTSRTVRAVEAGGMQSATGLTGQGSGIVSPFAPGHRDNGHQSATWGDLGSAVRTGTFQGSGGYVYEVRADQTIRIVSGPTSTGVIVRPGTANHANILRDLTATGWRATGGGGGGMPADYDPYKTGTGVSEPRTGGGAQVLNTLLSALSANIRPPAAQGPAFTPSPHATPPAAPAPAASAVPWGWIMGGVLGVAAIGGGIAIIYATRKRGK